MLTAALGTQHETHWTAELKAVEIPCGEVRDIAGSTRGSTTRSPADDSNLSTTSAPDTVRVLGVPTKLSDTPGSVRSAPPASVSTPMTSFDRIADCRPLKSRRSGRGGGELGLARGSGFGVPGSGSGFRVRVRGSGFGFRSGFRVRVPGSGFRVRVRGSRFKVPGSTLRRPGAAGAIQESRGRILLVASAFRRKEPYRSMKGVISCKRKVNTSSSVSSAIAAPSRTGRSALTMRRPRPLDVRPDDGRRVRSFVEHDFDELLVRALRRQPHRARGCEHLEQVPFAGKRRRQLVENRHCTLIEKFLVVACGGGDPGSTLRGGVASLFDGRTQAPPDFGNFHTLSGSPSHRG